jgi:hypothetical protein
VYFDWYPKDTWIRTHLKKWGKEKLPLEPVSDTKNDEDYDPGSSGSQKKKSGKRKSEGMNDADGEKKSRKTSQPLEDFDL